MPANVSFGGFYNVDTCLLGTKTTKPQTKYQMVTAFRYYLAAYRSGIEQATKRLPEVQYPVTSPLIYPAVASQPSRAVLLTKHLPQEVGNDTSFCPGCSRSYLEHSGLSFLRLHGAQVHMALTS